MSNYSYLGIEFASNGAWDVHLKKVLDNGRKKVNQLHSVISIRDINLNARRLLLLSVIRPKVRSRSPCRWEIRCSSTIPRPISKFQSSAHAPRRVGSIYPLSARVRREDT